MTALRSPLTLYDYPAVDWRDGAGWCGTMGYCPESGANLGDWRYEAVPVG